MGLTEELFVKTGHFIGNSNGEANVKAVFDLVQSGMVKEASQKMNAMSNSEILALNTMIEQSKVAGTGGKQSTVSGSAVEIASAGNRIEHGEIQSRSEVRPTNLSSLTQPNAGGAAKDNQGGGANSPTIGAMLNTPIKELLRLPSGDNSKDDIKKTAEFIKDFKDGIQEGVTKLAGLVAQKGSLDMVAEYGAPFSKMASLYGTAVATETTLRAHTDGIKENLFALINNQEVKVGSIDALINGQSKVAGLGDMHEFARNLGRMSVMNKVANLQAMDEGDAGLGMDEEEIPDEVVQELEALVDQATEAPESLTDEEMELILELSGDEEEAESALVGEEKVTSVMNIIAALRAGGYR